MISSGREFKELTINLKGCRILADNERIEEIVKKFGYRIKKFKIWCSVQSETSDISESQLTTILKLIPDVEELDLRNICVRASYSDFEELELHKMKKLSVDDCVFETPTFFNRIPADVIHDLVFTFQPNDETIFQDFFNRQRKIKSLEFFENDLINFNHLQLERLKISSGIDFAVMISQQPKLRYLDFAISWTDDNVFSELCKLKYLEVLKLLIDQISCREFKNLKELVRLKELRAESHSCHDCGHLYELSMMKSMQLEKLTLIFTSRKIPEEILIQISNNFHKIKNIELINRSIKIISVILENFPNLESLLFDFYAIFGAPDDILKISDGFKHENLQQLVITNINSNEVENSNSIFKLVEICPNLKRIMLSQLTGFTIDHLQMILESHSKLTHLSLDFDEFDLSYEVIIMIQDLGQNLVHLRLNGLTAFPLYLTLKVLFEEMFPNITLYKYSTGEGELIMKKRNVRDWYQDFKLMDHF